MSWVALAGLIALATATIRRARAETFHPLDAWVIGGGVALALVGLASTLLAAAGLLSAGSLALVSWGLTVGWWQRGGTGRLWARTDRLGVGAAALILLGLALRLPVIEFPLGGRDQGSYLLRAEHTARTGRLDATDPVVAAATTDNVRSGPADISGLYTRRTEAWRTNRYEAAYRPGFYLADFETGHVVPQFLHLYPSLLAAGRHLPGHSGARVWGPVSVLLSLVGLWALARRLFAPGWALCAVALYALSPLAIWVHRQTLTEPLAGALLLSAAVAVTTSGRYRSNRRYETAGFLLGTLAWVRGDAWVLLPVMLAVLWCTPDAAIGRRRGPTVLVILFLGSVALHALTSFPYVHDEFARHLGTDATPGVLVAIAVAGAALWWTGNEIAGGRPLTVRVLRWLPLALGGLMVGALGVWWSGDGPGFSRLDPLVPMLGWPLVLGAAAGVAHVAWSWRPAPTFVWNVAFAAIVAMTAILYAPHNLPKMGLYYYGRYLVPVLLPAAILAAIHVAALTWHGSAMRRILAAALVAGYAWPSLALVIAPQTRIQEFAGAGAAVARIADATEPNAVIVAGGEGWHHGHTFNQVGAALAFGHGRVVVPYRSDEAAAATLVELLVARPAATGGLAPPTYLLVNEASHPLEVDGGVRYSAFDDRLPAPLAVESVQAFEIILDRLTPAANAIPTRVTRDGLRMVLARITVRSESAPEIWQFEDGVSGPRRIAVQPLPRVEGPLCLDPHTPIRLEIPPDDRAGSLVTLVASPGTAAQNHGWRVTIDGDAQPLRPPRLTPRRRDTLGPFPRSHPPQLIEVRGSPLAVEGTPCPHGGLAELRIGTRGATIPPEEWSAVSLVPQHDLGHRPRSTSWVRGRALSRYRPLGAPTPQVQGVSLTLASRTPIDFGPTEIPAGPLQVVVTLTGTSVSPDARVVIRANGSSIAEIDPPESRTRSWQSAPVTWNPPASVVRIEVELSGATEEDHVELRDLAFFALASSVTSSVEVTGD